MKIHYLVLFAMVLCATPTLRAGNSCDYSKAHINYLKQQTEKAIEADNINTARYFAYKALNAIEKPMKQWDSCECTYSVKAIREGLSYLKKATKAFSLGGTRIHLKKVLEVVLIAEEALENHDSHEDSQYDNSTLELNTKGVLNRRAKTHKPLKGRQLERRIEASLTNFENSLAKVVASVDCKNALDFANTIYANCEKELKREDITEAKKYFNLKTKEIVTQAIVQLNNCPHTSVDGNY